ncbi:hypothetical protein AK88_03046 [Plasmodium fragile]|uniref:PP2A regulatory subunit B'' EF-hand domain-containing protein n=1 Tax=Plasmodium fragile TaxID=5857 RepID=A0A0D9QJR4_PLAFR|nr:uncharacterized protein AK88_03046 [Plasmodium fragile]KJP87249.1 hypothetical protein AK88_03046 [Plasmodium fragile]
MKQAEFIANVKMKTETANVHANTCTPPGSEKSEMKNLNLFPHLFLKGELMRQFLMDEDVWLFIQNFKMKLKESPHDVDNWLDYQLHLAKNNMGNLFHSDIPPFEHVKKNSEGVSSKNYYEVERNFGHPTDFAKRNDFSDQCGISSTCDDLDLVYPRTPCSRERDESDEEHNNDDEHKNDQKEGYTTTAVGLGTHGTSRVGINDILMRRMSQSEQGKGSVDRQVGYNTPTLTDDPHLGENTNRAESRHTPSGTPQRGICGVGSNLNVSSDGNDYTDVLTDENSKHYHNGEDMIIRKRHDGREEDKVATNHFSGVDKEEYHEIRDRMQQHRDRENFEHAIFSPQRKDVMKSIYEVSAAPMQCSEKDDMMITLRQTTHKDDGAHWKAEDGYDRDGTAKGGIPQDGTSLSEEALQGEEQFNQAVNMHVATNRGHEKQQRIAAPTMSKISTEESLLPKKNKLLEDPLHEDKQSKAGPTYNPPCDNTLWDKQNTEVPIVVIPQMTVTINKKMNEETDKKLKKIFSQYKNKMNLNLFEELIVVDFLKIGRYMSHTLYSRIDKVNEDFVTCEEVRKYFRNRFVDGTKDPSYYNDSRYRSLFERTRQGSVKSALHVVTPSNGDVEDISHLQNDTTPLHCDEHAVEGDDGGCSQKGEIADVPYKKCSIVNFFNAIKDPNRDYISFKDFDVFIREILKRNTSLQFLHEHVEFLERYIESVIVRIYYHIDVNDTNKIYLKDLRRHNLAHIWCCLDDNIKVQHVKNYFSYSHFYVYYCTFCQTSSCKDMLIDDNDLYRFDNHSLNDFIVNRIWSRVSIKLGGPNEKYMCLNDWIYFIMNYEDMTSNRAIEFWFKLIDLDADCVIRDHEIQVFFNIQMERLKSHYLEEPKFEDWLCQMNDAIQPKNEGNFTLSDFKRNKKYAARFFGCLVSLSKLLAWESRDVYKELQIETEFPHATPWEIFCKTKYDELCYMENEGCYEDNFDAYDAKGFYGMDSD